MGDDIMVARPESHAVPAPAVSIGNYKGVMLCNRPFAGVSAAARNAYSNKDSKPPFLSSCQNSERLGLNPIRSVPVVQQRKSKGNSALSRHKKWLNDLAKTKATMQDELLSEAKRKEEQRVRFAEQQRKERVMVVAARDPEERGVAEEKLAPYLRRPAAEAKTSAHREAAAAAPAEAKPAAPERRSSNQDEEEEELASERRGKRAAAAKPKWALTEQAASKLDDEEADDLLDFAKGLDFESYVDDMEVRTALLAIQERAETLRRQAEEAEAKEAESEVETVVDSTGFRLEREIDESLLDLDDGVAGMALDGEEAEGKPSRPARSRGAKATAEDAAAQWNSSTRYDEGKRPEGDEEDARSVAASVMSTASMKSLKMVHSARSIAKIAEQVKKEQAAAASMPVIEEAYAEPVIYVVQPASLREREGDVSNLPYMHRNPAV